MKTSIILEIVDRTLFFSQERATSVVVHFFMGLYVSRKIHSKLKNIEDMFYNLRNVW